VFTYVTNGKSPSDKNPENENETSQALTESNTKLAPQKLFISFQQRFHHWIL